MQKNTLLSSFGLCTLGIIFYFYVYYLRIIPSVLRPELKLMHNINESSFGFLVSLYYWAYLPLQIPAGLLIDLFGLRNILTAACLMCATGTYLFINNNLLLVQLGRFLIGFGSAFAYIGVLKLADDLLPKKYFAFIVGLCAGFGMLGAILGQLFIINYTKFFPWQRLLSYSAGIGILLSVILWRFIAKQKSINIKHNYYNKINLFVSFVKSPNVWLIGVISALMLVILTVFADTWAIAFLTTKGILEADAAISSAMVYLGFGIGAPLWGILSVFLLQRKLLVIIGCMITAVFMCIVLYLNIELIWLHSCMLFLGLFASTECLVFALINRLTDNNHAKGTLFGLINAIACLGGLLLQPIVGLIIDFLVLEYNFAEIINFQLALIILPISLLIALILNFYLKKDIYVCP